MQIFATDRAHDLCAQLDVYRKAHDSPTTDNLTIWRGVVNKAWVNLTPEEQADYEDRAQEYKELLDKLPTRAEVFK